MVFAFSSPPKRILFDIFGLVLGTSCFILVAFLGNLPDLAVLKDFKGPRELEEFL